MKYFSNGLFNDLTGGVRCLEKREKWRTPVISGNVASPVYMRGYQIPTVEVQPCLSNRSPATKKKNTTEITPFMVKNAAFSLLRSSWRTSMCS